MYCWHRSPGPQDDPKIWDTGRPLPSPTGSTGGHPQNRDTIGGDVVTEWSLLRPISYHCHLCIWQLASPCVRLRTPALSQAILADNAKFSRSHWKRQGWFDSGSRAPPKISRWLKMPKCQNDQRISKWSVLETSWRLSAWKHHPLRFSIDQPKDLPPPALLAASSRYQWTYQIGYGLKP